MHILAERKKNERLNTTIPTTINENVVNCIILICALFDYFVQWKMYWTTKKWRCGRKGESADYIFLIEFDGIFYAELSEFILPNTNLLNLPYILSANVEWTVNRYIYNLLRLSIYCQLMYWMILIGTGRLLKVNCQKGHILCRNQVHHRLHSTHWHTKEDS